MSLDQSFLRQIMALFGERATDAQAVRQAHGLSEAYHAAQPPDLVVFPESAEEAQQLVRLCARFKVPMIPFGAGTSLEGNASAPHGGVCVDMTHMNQVIEINADDLDCRVQPGITRKALNAHLRDAGLFFPIDPGADASIGGMTSTRASGTMAVRYGTMRENVIGLEAVMPNGELIRTSRRARKSSAGYDLTRLMVGAEGTLGLITEVTLRIYPLPEAVSAATCPFPSLSDAVRCVIEIMQMGLSVARIEFLDAVMIRGVNQHAKMSHAEAPTLFLGFHGTAQGVEEQARRAQEIALGHGGERFQWATQPEDRSRLWSARDNTLYAGLGLRPGAKAMITDVCVPISALAECLIETQTDIESSRLIVPIVGHVGDGNFHLLILVDPDDADEITRARHLHDTMVKRALRLQGTCTGEHGIGTGKMDFLEQELGRAVDVMRCIKAAIDPDNIMNPGKIFRREVAGV